MTETIRPVVEPGVAPTALPQFSLAFLRRSADIVHLLTPGGRVTFTNAPPRPGRRGPRPGPHMGVEIWEYWPDESESEVRDAVARAARGQCVRFRADLPDAAEVIREHDVLMTPIEGPEDAPTGLMAVCRAL